MITVLHGDDLSASYSRLQAILATSQNSQIIKFSSANTKEDLINAALTRDIFEKEKVIVCENFFASQKVKADDLSKIPKDTSVIFWEQKQLTPSVLTKLKTHAQVEIFKEKPQIFWFLDSISPSSQKTLTVFAKLISPDSSKITFHLANRMLYLILAKIRLTQKTSQQIVGRAIAPWQWERYQNQARQFNLDTLQKIYAGTLKIDSMIKRGETNLSPETLITILLAKYLQE